MIDVIDLLGVPGQATCLGRAEGAALAAFAVAPHRVVGPHARLRLAEPTTAYGARSGDLAATVEHHRARVGQLVERLTSATGRPADELAEELRRGRLCTAHEAVEAGLADEVATPEADIRRFPRQVGFRRR